MKTISSKSSNDHNRENTSNEKQDDCNNPSNDQTQDKYQQLISTLPNDEGSTIPGSANYFQYQYQGFWYYKTLLEGLLAAQEKFEAQQFDIILSSAPKSGTAWLKALTYAILTRNNNLRNNDHPQTNPLFSSMPHDLIPFLEIDVGLNYDQFNRKSLIIPVVATHTPYSALPKSILLARCKIVYICRNPKDAFVSLWHFTNKTRKSKYKESEPIPIEKFLLQFCQGISFYGPYWDHVLEYWKASLEQPEKILFLKYEEMMNETKVCVKRLAEFLGRGFSEEEEVGGVVEKIVDMCSFQNLSNLEVNRSGKHRAETAMEMDNNLYFRKGKVGDWENYLTKEMAEKIDRITHEKFEGSGLEL